MKIFAFANRKGGTGKSTYAALTSLNLAKGSRVLLIDTDEQQALINNIKLSEKTLDIKYKFEYDFLEFDEVESRIKKEREEDNYDYILIDTPGFLKKEAVKVFYHVDRVILTIKAGDQEQFTYLQFIKFLDQINELKKKYNEKLVELSILFNEINNNNVFKENFKEAFLYSRKNKVHLFHKIDKKNNTVEPLGLRARDMFKVMFSSTGIIDVVNLKGDSEAKTKQSFSGYIKELKTL